MTVPVLLAVIVIAFGAGAFCMALVLAVCATDRPFSELEQQELDLEAMRQRPVIEAEELRKGGKL